MTLRQLRRGLAAHYRAPQRTIFRQFRAGAIYFAVGLATLLWAGTQLPPSAAQEWVVLGGLVLGGLGFIMALAAEVRFLISRLLRFFDV